MSLFNVDKSSYETWINGFKNPPQLTVGGFLEAWKYVFESLNKEPIFPTPFLPPDCKRTTNNNLPSFSQNHPEKP